ncbi:GldG family protein [Oceanibaculum pacificum]|uniref:ABC transporter n=1 Tax=Oceanibaculum pacificum TaxID=580166 RepID=A0A154WGD8_9PROT|nr:Gldg family protein [Oceanibaculum pacificum]KZD12591.1 ABC transporter [Oceanibaculum pacificum]
MANASTKRIRPVQAWIALALIALLFVAVNLIVGNGVSSARLDLTEDRLYTLAPATRATLKEIEEPITLRLFYSERLGREAPAYATYSQRVRNLLQEYANLSNGKIKLEIFDPEPFSRIEDRAVSYGLQGVPLDQSGEMVYFGLVGTNLTDDEQTIAFFQPERERFLEYDLTRIVQNLAKPERKLIGMISGLPLEGRFGPGGQASPPWTILQQMRQIFSVRTMGNDVARIDSDVDTLFVVHPRALPDTALYAIDQFMMRGGRALFFVDPFSEADAAIPDPRGMPKIDTSSSLAKLFDAWGVSVTTDQMVGDRVAARRVNVGGGGQVMPVDYVLWLNLQARNLNHDDPVTGDLQQLSFATAGAVSLKDGASLAMTPLVSSSPLAQMIPVARIRPRPDPMRLLRDYKPGDQQRVLAARFTGPLTSAFPEGAPKPAEGQRPTGEEPAAPLARSEKDAAFVVVADTDLLDDRFWVQVQDFFGQQVATPFAGNGDFVMNALESLSGDSRLLDLRGRGIVARPFTTIDDIRREADQRYRAQEQTLKDNLQESLAKLEELRSKDAPGGGAILTAEQRSQIAAIQQTILDTRQQLREVQRSLRQDIDRLESRLLFLNIGLVPLLVAALAILIGLYRMARRRRKTAAAQGA